MRRYLNLAAFNSTDLPMRANLQMDLPGGLPSPREIIVMRAACSTGLVPLMTVSDLSDLHLGVVQLANLANSSISSLANYWISPGAGAANQGALYSWDQFCEIANFCLAANLPTGATGADAPKLSLNSSRDALVLTVPNAAYRMVCNAAAHSVLGSGWNTTVPRGRPFHSVVLGSGQQEKSTLSLLQTATHILITSTDLGATYELTGSTGAARVAADSEAQLTDIAISGANTEILLQPAFERVLTCTPSTAGLGNHISVQFHYRDARGDVHPLMLPPHGRASIKIALVYPA